VAAAAGMLPVAIVGLNGFATRIIPAKSASPTSASIENFDRRFLNLSGVDGAFISHLRFSRSFTFIIRCGAIAYGF